MPFQTYTFIVNAQKRKHELDQIKMHRERRRISALQKADSERRYITKLMLTAAGCPYVGEHICKPCDPVRREEDTIDHQRRSVSVGNEMVDEESEVDATPNNDGSGSAVDAEIEFQEPLTNEDQCLHDSSRDHDVTTKSTSALHAAMEQRKIQQTMDAEAGDAENSSQVDGTGNVEFVATSGK